MFSQQAPQLYNSLVAAGATDAMAKAIMDCVGNCAQPLEHRGPITLDAPSVPQYADTADASAFPDSGNALNIAPGSMIRGQGRGTGANISRPSVLWWDGIVQLTSLVIMGAQSIFNIFGNIVIQFGGGLTFLPGSTVTGFPYSPAGIMAAMPIGSIMGWRGSIPSIPSGWEVITGADGRYLVLDSTGTGGFGGNATHNHTGSTGTTLTGLTVSNHTDHTHAAHGTLTVTLPFLDTAVQAVGTAFGNSTPDLGSNAGTFDVVGNTGNNNSTLTHTVVESPHLHGISSANNDPLFFKLVLIAKVS